MKYNARPLLAMMCVCAMITAGCDDDSVSPVETPAPAPPTNLTATPLNQSTIQLDWTASATSIDSIASYILHVSGSSDSNIVSKMTSSYNVTGLSAGTNYTFTLWSRGLNGKLSTAATVQGRTQDDTIPAPAPPTNLRAASGDYQSVLLKWDASVSANEANFANYELTVTPNGGNPLPAFAIAKGQTSYKVTGLTEGTIYTFSLKAKNTSTTNNLSNAATVQWSPATRYIGMRLFETASTQFGAGINLSTGEVLKVSDGARWDIALDTRVVNGVVDNVLGTPSLLTYTIQNPRSTLISSKIITGATSLDDVFETQALGDASFGMRPDSARYIRIDQFSNNIVFFVRTVDGNYAKVLVKAANGKLLQSTAPNRYVEMDISYQSATNIPYAFVRGGNSPWNFKTTSISTGKKASE